MSKNKGENSATRNKVNPASLDISTKRINDLKMLFPDAICEGQIDFDRLKKLLDGSLVAEPEGERYGLSWAGKNDCFRHIQEPTTATLKPARKESVDFDHTKNLFVEGDNLQILKILQKSYYGAVKMIYIDPPYNTGNDSFIYPDRFSESQDEYLKRIGDKDAEGNLIKDGFWRKNSKDAGHFHSNWLSMMYPRLFLARNLLCNDGVICISIDDSEQHNLKLVLNEIFGEENHIATVVWQKRYVSNVTAKWLSDMHDFIFIYARNKEYVQVTSWQRNNEQLKAYKNPDNDHRGPWRAQDLSASKPYNAGLFTITGPTGKQFNPPPNRYWRCNKQQFEKWEKDNCIWWGVNEDSRPMLKSFLSDSEEGITPHTWWSYDFAGHNKEATLEVKTLFDGSAPFDTPKPIKLIQRLLNLLSGQDSIILDFFAGSCTTAHAVMQLNAEDGGNRKFICVQLPEPCDENSEAFRTGYKTIADIGKERIRRAAKKIANETQGKLDFEGSKPDLGFKVFRLDESNFKEWRSDVKTADALEHQMFDFIDNVKPNANKENILFELILKSGLDLNVPVEERKIDGSLYYRIDGGKLIICLEDKITKKLVEAILKEKPEKALCLDRAFENNDQLKTNTILQMEAEKIEFRVI